MARKTFRPIRASAATRAKYEKAIMSEIEDMVRSLRYWLAAAYRADTPATTLLAQDASASKVLQAAFDRLAARWQRRFDELGPKLAGRFVTDHRNRVDRSMRADMREAGFTVKFTMTSAMRDAFNAVVDENIGLISSIAEQHLQGVRTALTQSVQNGRDLGYLTEQLTKRAGITQRRAARIARDQNNKATAVMQRTRALELGVKKAKWMHSGGGKNPRPDHTAFHGHIYEIDKGHDFDNGEGVVWPGTAINCRCYSVSIIPGFD